MFRCTDCGQEYEIKPDYCDCGNNVFENLTHVESQPGQQIKVSEVKESQDVKMPEINYNRKGSPLLQFLSVMIFLACLILAVLSVIYIGKDSLEKMEQEQKQGADKVSVKNADVKIPPINSIWVENKNRQVKEENYPVENKVTVVYSASEKKNQTEVKKTEPAAAPKKVTTSKPVKTAAPAVSTAVKSPSAKSTAVQKTASTVKTNTQTAAKTAATQKTTSTAKQQTSTVKQTTNTQTTAAKQTDTQKVATQVQTKVSEPIVNEAQLKAEVYNYKIALRNKLSSNISFAQIVGDGTCSVTFRVDSSGNLIGRKFSRQSDNDSLNRVVYDAIIKNPTFNSPPAGYKGEVLTFTVKMYGGHFTVTLN